MSGKPCTNCGKYMCDCPPGVNMNLASPSVEIVEAAAVFEATHKKYHTPRRRARWSAEWYLKILEDCVEDDQGLLWPKGGRKVEPW